jgi:putative transcriptional regulator
MRKELFDDLLESVREAGAIMRGEMAPSRVFEFTPLDIKAIRGKLNKSQREFALMIGVSTSTLQNWEQGRRIPRGPARALLKVAEKNPQAVAEALEI